MGAEVLAAAVVGASVCALGPTQQHERQPRSWSWQQEGRGRKRQAPGAGAGVIASSLRPVGADVLAAAVVGASVCALGPGAGAGTAASSRLPVGADVLAAAVVGARVCALGPGAGAGTAASSLRPVGAEVLAAAVVGASVCALGPVQQHECELGTGSSSLQRRGGAKPGAGAGVTASSLLPVGAEVLAAAVVGARVCELGPGAGAGVTASSLLPVGAEVLAAAVVGASVWAAGPAHQRQTSVGQACSCAQKSKLGRVEDPEP